MALAAPRRRADGDEHGLGARDRRFQIGVQIIRSHLDSDRAGLTYSDVADATINALLPWVEDDFARRRGAGFLRLDVDGDLLAQLASLFEGGRFVA